MSEDERGDTIHNLSASVRMKSKARANADILSSSNAVNTFVQLKQISEQMHMMHAKLSEEGVDAQEFIDRMQSMSCLLYTSDAADE